MYRRPKFLEKLLEIRREMAREADYDVDLFVELARAGEPLGDTVPKGDEPLPMSFDALAENVRAD